MRRPLRVVVLNRRDFVIEAASAGAVAALLASLGTAEAGERSAGFEAALRKVLGEAKAEDGKVALDLDDMVENGNIARFEIHVESPMTPADHVKAIHLLSTANPQPRVATFHLTPLSGRASIKGRMRLAKTQDVVAVAELSSGAFLMGTRFVKVAIGGCGN